MKTQLRLNRRLFVKTSLLTGVAALAKARGIGTLLQAAASVSERRQSRVAVTAGADRADNVFRGLRMFQEEIRRAIGGRRVLIKPNNVAIDRPLCATHAGCLEGILEFLNSIGKTDVIIGESAASGPTLDGFDHYGYRPLASRYQAKLFDLDSDQTELLYVFDEKDFRPHPMRVAKTILDPDYFIISAAKLKTHDRVVATLSLKNIVVGAPIKDPGFCWGPASKPGAKNDKPITHGNGFRAINYNLFALAERLHPHLAVIDGFEGMEGNGPIGGTAVDHRVAVISLDWLAADRVALELMGIDFSRVGYLSFCAQARMGEADLANMEILGEPIARHRKSYKLHRNLDQQLIWMTPVGSA